MNSGSRMGALATLVSGPLTRRILRFATMQVKWPLASQRSSVRTKPKTLLGAQLAPRLALPLPATVCSWGREFTLRAPKKEGAQWAVLRVRQMQKGRPKLHCSGSLAKRDRERWSSGERQSVEEAREEMDTHVHCAN